MKYLYCKAFTLIEIVVGISISMILMVSLSLFVTSGMQQITLQKNILDTQKQTQIYKQKMENIFSRNILGVQAVGSGVFLQTDMFLWKWNGVFIAPKTSSWYCWVDPDLETTHIELYEFVWYEWMWGDFFNGRVFSNEGNDVFTFSWSGFSGSVFPTDVVLSWSQRFFTDYGNHQVFVDDQKIYGKWIFGSQTWYLNTPTGIAFGWGKIFVSDTGNNRIVSFDEHGNNFEEILNYKDGISAPMWLFYTGWTLFISDSGNGRILKYSSEEFSNIPEFVAKFTPTQTQTLTGMSVKFLSHTWWEILLSHSGTLSWWGTGSIVWNNLEYEFDERDVFAWSEDSFTLSWLNNWNFSQTGSYIAEIILWNETFFVPYFTQWDGNIFTKSDNTLEIFATGFSLPTGIFGSWGNIVVNDFITREWQAFDIEWSFTTSWALSQIDFSSLPQHPLVYSMSDFVVEPDSFQIAIEENIFHVSFDYYIYYDCIDPEKSAKRTMIMKKYLD